MIKKPYLLFLGDAHDRLAAKVAIGIRDWRPHDVVGQLRLAGCKPDLLIPELTIGGAVENGAQTMVVGVANRGGIIAKAIEAGLDVASGLHQKLTDIPGLAEAAERRGCKLHDVRTARTDYPIADGRRRTGKRCLAVGTDTSVGKMYVALAMEREMIEQGNKATFRATGQTGILIQGSGVPLDAVVGDFMAGAVEELAPDNDEDHWDFVEGQGSLFHASYSGVTLALIHGSKPDALVLCQDPTRETMRGLPMYKQPSLIELRDVALTMARIVNPDCKVIGISINTSEIDESDAKWLIEAAEKETNLPATDPVRFGVRKLVNSLLED